MEIAKTVKIDSASSPLDSLKLLMKIIKEETENTDFNTVVTNSQLASFLMDGLAYEGVPVAPPKVNLKEVPKEYTLVKLKYSELRVDPNMRWTDTLLIFKSGKVEKIIKIESENLLI